MTLNEWEQSNIEVLTSREMGEWLCRRENRLLDKIRAEIEGKYRVILKGTPKDYWAVRWNDCLDEVLQIIDKYKAESEEV